ncbi:MAG: FMN-binding protein [Candidatus Omnitrophota bacterium]
MKKCIFFMGILVLVLSFNVCSAEAQYKDGVYEGEHSFLKVAVTIQEGKISDVEIMDHSGGDDYTALIEPLSMEIVEKQSTKVDAVTGATTSSEALKQAVDNALEKAFIEKCSESNDL